MAFAAACSPPAAPVIAPDPSVPSVALSESIKDIQEIVLSDSGAVVAGTKSGLFSINSNGKVSRVGTTNDNFAALVSIPGAKRMYASGHPGSGSTQADPLGLNVSLDDGLTWTNVALAGKNDFHTLGVSGATIIAFDGDRLYSSEDGGQGWLPRAKLSVLSMAVFETTIYVTTPDGLEVSTDGANSFDKVSGAEKMRLIAAAPDGSLWGVDSDGYAGRSKDGQNWDRREKVGTVNGIVASSYDLAYAASASKLLTLS